MKHDSQHMHANGVAQSKGMKTDNGLEDCEVSLSALSKGGLKEEEGNH